MKIVVYSILVCLISAIGCSNSAKEEQQSPLIKFGVIADIQYCDDDAHGSRYYRNSLHKLDSAIIDLNKNDVQFTAVLGDLVDRDTNKNLDSVVLRLNKLDSTVHNTTGNHDYGGITDNSALYAKLNMPSEYYSFSGNGWVFIMLNTNEIASYSNIADTEKEREYEEMLEIITKEGRNNGASYNGGISKKQLKWLEAGLNDAQKKNRNVLIFTHHPLYGVSGLTALNAPEIIDVLSKYPCVKCVVSGHHHAGAFELLNNIAFITTEGMVETENENAYGIVEIYHDRIEFAGKGRSQTHTIVLNHNNQ